MTIEDVEDIARQGESDQVEFKKTTGQRQRAAETVCAMLNGRGGNVLFGVRNDGTIEGQEVTDATLRDVVRELRKIEPQVVLQPDVVPVDEERSVVVLSVPGERAGPFTYDGRPYVRQGPTTGRMDQELYRQRVLQRGDPGGRWESRPARDVTLDDLDLTEVTRTIEEAIRRGRMEEPSTRDPEELLLGLGLIREGKILNAAVILFGKEDGFLPYYPQCLLRMARFRGTTKTEFEDNRQMRAHAFALYRQAQRFLREHLPIASRVLPDRFEREDTPLYPMEALREALANALCHRDYSKSGSVGVAIYDDRLEISSTGTLPPGITIDDLTRPHASQLRNDLIAGAFYRCGLIEQWGRGTLKMAELTEQAGLVPPEFEERSGELVVRFRPTHYVAPRRTQHDLSPLQQELLQIVGNRGPVAISEIEAELTEEVARRTVQKHLVILRELGLVTMVGEKRGARWLVPPA